MTSQDEKRQGQKKGGGWMGGGGGGGGETGTEGQEGPSDDPCDDEGTGYAVRPQAKKH